MGQLIISESEKNRIRLLYEDSNSDITPSAFVTNVSRILGVDQNLMLALDWSLYENDKTKKDKLSQLFSQLTPAVNNRIAVIKKGINLNSVRTQLNNQIGKPGNTKKQDEFLRATIAQLDKSSQTTTTTQPKTSTPSTNQSKPTYTYNPPTTPKKPTLSLYRSLAEMFSK